MSGTTNDARNTSNDEIDLLDLFRRIGRTLNRWAIAVFNAILHSIVFLIKRWLPLSLSIILGIGISYLLKVTTTSYFTSDLVLRTNSFVPLSKRELPRANLITTDDLISFINRNSSQIIGRISSGHKMVNISDIGAYWIIDLGKDGIPDFVDYAYNQNVYDTVNVRMKDRFDIRIKFQQLEELQPIRDEIINFIQSDSMFQRQNKIRLRQSQEMIRRLDYDIQQLDSLQRVKYIDEPKKMTKNGGQIVFIQDQKTQLLYPDIQTLYAKKQALETDMDLYKEIVTTLNDFSKPTSRVNGLGYYAKTVVPGIFLLTLIILIISANRKKLREVYNKY